MAKKEKTFYSVNGLFIDKADIGNMQDQYEEKIILLVASDEEKAAKKAKKVFKAWEDKTFKFLNKMDICELFDDPIEGGEIFWRRRISDLSPKKYVATYWDDGKPTDCKDNNWKHAWYKLDDTVKCCYNCYAVKFSDVDSSKGDKKGKKGKKKKK